MSRAMASFLDPKGESCWGNQKGAVISCWQHYRYINQNFLLRSSNLFDKTC